MNRLSKGRLSKGPPTNGEKCEAGDSCQYSHVGQVIQAAKKIEKEKSKGGGKGKNKNKGNKVKCICIFSTIGKATNVALHAHSCTRHPQGRPSSWSRQLGQRRNLHQLMGSCRVVDKRMNSLSNVHPWLRVAKWNQPPASILWLARRSVVPARYH